MATSHVVAVKVGMSESAKVVGPLLISGRGSVRLQVCTTAQEARKSSEKGAVI